MSRELRIEFEHAFYHVMARGNTRSRIFKTDLQREKFLDYLHKLHEKYQVKIHAYCLMSNHYHLLIETPQGNLSRVMHTLNTSYTNFYNYHNKRSGHLFSGRYKAILVEKDTYAQILSSYIHLNPVRAKLVNTSGEYQWSSFKYYSGKDKKIPDFIYTDLILGYFDNDIDSSRQKYISYVNERKKSRKDPFRKMKVENILGSDEYVEDIRTKAEEFGWVNRKIEFTKNILDKKKLERKIRKIVGNENDIGESLRRKILIYLLRKEIGKSLWNIGVEFGIKASAVHMISRRFEAEMEKKKEVRNKFEGMVEKINDV